jgi:hypothetical protein
MPRLSVYFVRASLIYLAVGFTFGALLLANKGVLISPLIWELLPLHIEFLLVGFLVQLALGVAFWILPRFSQGPLRGDERWSWITFATLNIGVCLAAVQGWFGPTWLIFFGRSLEMLGLVTFVIGNWRRVKPSGRG